VTKEKTALAERLKKAEAAQRRLEEEVKRHAIEAVKFRKLESDMRQLEVLLSKADVEKREKQKQAAQSEAYIDGLEVKLQAAQVRLRFIKNLCAEINYYTMFWNEDMTYISLLFCWIVLKFFKFLFLLYNTKMGIRWSQADLNEVNGGQSIPILLSKTFIIILNYVLLKVKILLPQ
jgi:hypothetical protein